MNQADSLRIDLVAARYLQALERHDFVAKAEICGEAGHDAELEAALHEIHAGLLEEQLRSAQTDVEEAVAAAVVAHLPSAEVASAAAGPLTVSDVAQELFRRPPSRLAAAAHAFNESLRGRKEPLPGELGLGKLVVWAEATLGPAAPEYWKAFRQAAIKIELQRAAEAEYRLAARPAPKPDVQP